MAQSDVNDITLTADSQQIITSHQAWHYHIIPKSVGTQSIEFFIDERTFESHLESELTILLGKKVILEKTDTAVISKALVKFYRKTSAHSKAHVSKLSVAASSNEFLPNLISEAKEAGSTDIHFESYEDRCRIRIRIDGQLIEK